MSRLLPLAGVLLASDVAAAEVRIAETDWLMTAPAGFTRISDATWERTERGPDGRIRRLAIVAWVGGIDCGNYSVRAGAKPVIVRGHAALRGRCAQQRGYQRSKDDPWHFGGQSDVLLVELDPALKDFDLHWTRGKLSLRYVYDPASARGAGIKAFEAAIASLRVEKRAPPPEATPPSPAAEGVDAPQSAIPLLR